MATESEEVIPVIAPMTTERVEARRDAVYFFDIYSGPREVRPDGTIRRLSNRAVARILTETRGDDLGRFSPRAVGKYRRMIAGGYRPRPLQPAPGQ